ncbi:MAG: neutral/alkaline non-lysosomal ceramidase N-terminal domain-containing protein [Chitinophagales bacterium]|nr:neutral/alkaline non-lysosomal ceramidase N-terminal domain-containing protein [Chitinophagales bacterium]
MLLFFCSLFIASFKIYDNTPYVQTEAYRRQMLLMDSICNMHESYNNSDLLKVGWAKVNLLPPFTTPIAIDAHRGGKHFNGVHDSIYVRAFVFKSGSKKVAYISADLLIIPSTVSSMFDTLMDENGFNRENIFFTATHTHSSIGAWYNSLIGEKFAGKYDERVPLHIASCIREAILQAEANVEPSETGYGTFPTSKLVINRLVGEKGSVDSMLRVFKIKQTQTGKTAAIITFAAHATVYHENMMQLSADWPGLLVKQLEDSLLVDFACFSAGAVGSHGPCLVSENENEQIVYMATGVRKVLEESFTAIRCEPLHTSLKMNRMQLYLREPNLRIGAKTALRPWVFKKLFGNESVFLLNFTLNNVAFVGTPCDFSGELMYEIDSAAMKTNKSVMLTGFNGGYMGYVTHDRWNQLNEYETRTMNWFGPESGSYLQHTINRLVAE